MAEWAADCGMPYNKVASANTALEVLTLADDNQAQKLAQLIAQKSHQKVKEILRDAPVRVEIMLVRRDGTLLCRHKG